MMKHKVEENNLEQVHAKKIVTLLDGELASMDPKITSKLSYARQQALANMAVSSSAMAVNHRGVLRMFGGYWHQHRLLSMVVVLSTVFMTFFIIHNIASQEVVEQGDAYLLGSELPPEAYLNEGFDTWLSENSAQQ